MRDQILSGKSALVTGASRGIGRAVAQRLAAAGATVIVTARSCDKPLILPGTLRETVALIESAGGKAIPLATDLEDPEQRDSLIARASALVDNLQILVNSAGLLHLGTIESMSLKTFDLTVDHYLRIPFALAKSAIPLMRELGAGWIVNIGSGTDRMPTQPFNEFDRSFGGNVLLAIKLGLRRLTVGLAAELERDNIAVNMAIPSTPVSTPGADRHYPPNWPREPIEYIAEAVLSLCHVPAKDRTGVIASSAEFKHNTG